MEQNMYNDYTILNKRLRFEQSMGTIKTEKEFLDIRDLTIRSMYPERFDGLEKTIICAECGKFKILTDLVCSETDTFYSYKWEDSHGVRAYLSACCTEHYDRIIKRVASYHN